MQELGARRAAAQISAASDDGNPPAGLFQQEISLLTPSSLNTSDSGLLQTQLLLFSLALLVVP